MTWSFVFSIFSVQLSENVENQIRQWSVHGGGSGDEFIEGSWNVLKFVWSALQVVRKENRVKVLGVR